MSKGLTKLFFFLHETFILNSVLLSPKPDKGGMSAVLLGSILVVKLAVTGILHLA